MPYALSLLDRLFDDEPDESESKSSLPCDLENLKVIVSRDLENLLNTRSELTPLDVEKYVELRRSVLTYGLPDFSTLNPNSVEDHQKVCEAVADVIARFEPRLKQIAVQLNSSSAEQARQEFSFQINALLMTDREPENVVFNAVLEASTQHYRIID